MFCNQGSWWEQRGAEAGWSPGKGGSRQRERLEGGEVAAQDSGETFDPIRAPGSPFPEHCGRTVLFSPRAGRLAQELAIRVCVRTGSLGELPAAPEPGQLSFSSGRGRCSHKDRHRGGPGDGLRALGRGLCQTSPPS